MSKYLDVLSMGMSLRTSALGKLLRMEKEKVERKMNSDKVDHFACISGRIIAEDEFPFEGGNKMKVTMSDKEIVDFYVKHDFSPIEEFTPEMAETVNGDVLSYFLQGQGNSVLCGYGLVMDLGNGVYKKYGLGVYDKERGGFVNYQGDFLDGVKAFCKTPDYFATVFGRPWLLPKNNG